jgi:MoxR-like ATPase
MTDAGGVGPGLEAEIRDFAQQVERIGAQIARRMVGQRELIDRLLMALVAEGHVLLEGLPGLAKTTAIKTLAEVCALSSSRIQFTPDLLPADLTGTQIYDPRALEFRVRKGPLFANLVLADEINRAPAKVQSALLEAMQERQITIGESSFPLPRPFLVLATQNPIEQEGTYPLPEAQVDRFLFKVKVGYGTPKEEEEIVARSNETQAIQLDRIADPVVLERMRAATLQVRVVPEVRRYLVQIVFATRTPSAVGLNDLARFIEVGASPRASIGLERAARVNAVMRGRTYVTPQDVKDVGLDVLRHRILLTYEAEAERVSTDDIVRRIFERVDVP